MMPTFAAWANSRSISLYDEYLPLLRLDVAKYVEETRRRDPEEEEGRPRRTWRRLPNTRRIGREEMVPRRSSWMFTWTYPGSEGALGETRGTGGRWTVVAFPRKSPTR